MENEINKIKLEYQSITPSKDMLVKGLDDLWHRVDKKQHFIQIYFAQITTVILFFVVISGLIGIKSAQAKEGTVFYPIKKLAQKTLTVISETPVAKFYNSQINHVFNLNKNKELTPTNSPIPTEAIKPESEKNNDNPKNDSGKNSELDNNQNLNKESSGNEDIKGASISEKKRDSNNSENNQSKNNSIQSESQNHSNDNNSNSQNQNKENGDQEKN